MGGDGGRVERGDPYPETRKRLSRKRLRDTSTNRPNQPKREDTGTKRRYVIPQKGLAHTEFDPPGKNRNSRLHRSKKDLIQVDVRNHTETKNRDPEEHLH